LCFRNGPLNGSLLEHALTKRQSQSRGEQKVIALQAGRRIADVVVVKRDLPAEPILQFGSDVGIEAVAIAAGAAKSRVNGKILADGQMVPVRRSPFFRVTWSATAAVPKK
jgi:hypothetical protein